MGRTTAARLFAAGALVLAGLAATVSPAAAVDKPWFGQTTGSAVSVGGTFRPIVGNFNGSPEDDIVWYAPGSGTDHLWTSNADKSFSKAALSTQVNGTYTPIVGDFAGDNFDDIFWYGVGSVPDSLWIGHDGGSFTTVSASVSGTYQPFVVTDSRFDLGGTDDIVWYAPGSGADSMWVFTTAQGAHTSLPLTIPGSPKPLVGNFDGDGYADVFWYTAGTTAEELWRGTNGAGGFIKSGFNVNGTYQPVVEDFTPFSDGRSDILWFKSGAGGDQLWQGKASGGFSPSSPNIADVGTPIALNYEWGYTYTVNPSGPDRIWYSNAPDADTAQNAANTELPAGYTPIVGEFVDAGDPVVFWYKAGSAPEYLFS